NNPSTEFAEPQDGVRNQKTKARNQKVKRGGLNPSTFPILYHKCMNKILNYLLIISIMIILLLLSKLAYNKRKKAKLEIEKHEIENKKGDYDGKE
ncbi:hypothetical protein, partial [Clostridium botulinum]|uniref:hypothetical protein n=2 Tax=Clostridium botulinum TaxID=1491 RepID=UPI001389D262